MGAEAVHRCGGYLARFLREPANADGKKSLCPATGRSTAGPTTHVLRAHFRFRAEDLRDSGRADLIPGKSGANSGRKRELASTRNCVVSLSGLERFTLQLNR
jgi:hypothetical protein